MYSIYLTPRLDGELLDARRLGSLGGPGSPTLFAPARLRVGHPSEGSQMSEPPAPALQGRGRTKKRTEGSSRVNAVTASQARKVALPASSLAPYPPRPAHRALPVRARPSPTESIISRRGGKMTCEGRCLSLRLTRGSCE